MTGQDTDKSRSLGREIAEDYYRTTASRAHRRDRTWYEHASQQKWRFMRQWLPADKSARILEIGCGCGEMLYALEKWGYMHLVGVDCCREELNEAGRFVQARLVCEDIVAFLRGESEHYDLLIAYNVLEHFNKDNLLAVLRGACGVLKPGGALAAMVPNAVSPFGSVTRYWDVSHEMAFTTNSWRQLAPLAGFEERPEFRECGPVPHGFVSGLRYLLWQGIRLLIKARLLCETASTRGNIYTQDMLVLLRKPRVAARETG